MFIKATHQEALGFYMFHCFNISNHMIIGISVLFFIISISCFVGFFAGFLKIKCPASRVLAQFFCPKARGFAFSLCHGGWGILPFKKIPWGLARGEWSGLELTDT